jgi:hypothetical protein
VRSSVFAAGSLGISLRMSSHLSVRVSAREEEVVVHVGGEVDMTAMELL